MRGVNFYHASHTQICVPLSPPHLEFGEGSREFFPYLFFSEQEKELSVHLCVCIFSSEGKSALDTFSPDTQQQLCSVPYLLPGAQS